jgi:predicted Zn-dependent peptidase
MLNSFLFPKTMNIDIKRSLHFLRNGIRVLLLDTPGDLFTCWWGIMGGSDLEERDEIEGMHLLEHLNGGFTSCRNSSEIKVLTFLSDRAIDNNAYTSETETAYYASGLKRFAREIFNLFVESYSQFRLDEEIFENERESVVRELENNLQRQTPPQSFISEVLYPGTNRVISIKDRLRNAERLTKEDILSLRDRHYTTQRLFFIVATSGIRQCAPQILRRLEAIPASPFPRRFRTMSPVSRPPGPVIQCQIGGQATIFLALPLHCTYFERYVAGCFIDLLVGMGMTSRLLFRLRLIEGLIYSIDTSIEYHPYEASYSMLTLTIPCDEESVDDVFFFLCEELDRLVYEGIDEKEIYRLRIKVRTRLQQAALDQSAGRYINDYLPAFLWRGGIARNKEDMMRYLRVSHHEVNEYARRILRPRNLYFCITTTQERPPPEGILERFFHDWD